VSWHQKGKTNLDLLEQEIMSDSGISWTVCKSAQNHASIPPLAKPTQAIYVLFGW